MILRRPPPTTGVFSASPGPAAAPTPSRHFPHTGRTSHHDHIISQRRQHQQAPPTRCPLLAACHLTIARRSLVIPAKQPCEYGGLIHTGSRATGCLPGPPGELVPGRQGTRVLRAEDAEHGQQRGELVTGPGRVPRPPIQ